MVLARNLLADAIDGSHSLSGYEAFRQVQTRSRNYNDLVTNWPTGQLRNWEEVDDVISRQVEDMPNHDPNFRTDFAADGHLKAFAHHDPPAFGRQPEIHERQTDGCTIRQCRLSLTLCNQRASLHIPFQKLSERLIRSLIADVSTAK